MDSKNIVKKDVLFRKIQEYFSKNPKKQSAIFHSDLGENTYWSVKREGKSYRITEVITKRESFVVEAPQDDKTGVGGKPLYNPNGPQPQKSASGTKFTNPPNAVGPTGTKVLRKPEPMDGGGAHKPVDPAKAQAYTQRIKDMLKWQPNDPNSEFSKSLHQTKDLKASIKKMPPDHFKINFGWTGATSADQLVNSPDLMSKTTDYLSQHNPLVAQMLGKKLPFGSKPPPIAASAKHEGRLTEVSSEFSQISRDFMDSMNGFDHYKLSKALKTLQTNLPKLHDPKEIQQAGMMSGVLTNAVDSTTAQAGRSTKTTVTAGKTNSGRRLSEDDSKKKEEKPSKKKKEDDLETGSLDAPTEEPEKTPSEEPQTPSPEEDFESQPAKDQEQAVMSDRLSGQTIKNVSIDLGDGKGGKLSLDLVGTKIPATLSWDPSGKVVFTFKNRPYILRH